MRHFLAAPDAPEGRVASLVAFKDASYAEALETWRARQAGKGS